MRELWAEQRISAFGRLTRDPFRPDFSGSKKHGRDDSVQHCRTLECAGRTAHIHRIRCDGCAEYCAGHRGSDGEGIDDHWVSTSYELLVGVILNVKYDEQDKSLAGCSTYLADPSFTDPEQMFICLFSRKRRHTRLSAGTPSSCQA